MKLYRVYNGWMGFPGWMGFSACKTFVLAKNEADALKQAKNQHRKEKGENVHGTYTVELIFDDLTKEKCTEYTDE